MNQKHQVNVIFGFKLDKEVHYHVNVTKITLYLTLIL